MAKSTRSKVKRTFRAKKRTEGVFAAAEAARLQRLNAKLRALTNIEEDGDHENEKPEEDPDIDMPAQGAEPEAELVSPTAEGVNGKGSQKSMGRISTHGPRGSRREQWRASKGMIPRPKSRGMNGQGIIAARYKPGRSHRRR
ncbi:hypothetical protein B0F90DRAFT_1667668 [Multifurca ochricompacta]|uniref:DUF2423 domain-containing protein n=1 Tax=Multifurca ochricompacta TaxID=376703 RepID=A0AAD4M4K7_9AGAM|nr:hypothetical protein B0F90DRAFT_1667668 [Multifurca ochricompacta]